MTATTDELYSLLIPLERERLVLPRASVAEVIRYTAPADGDDDRWLRGFISWNSVNIPVVSVEQLCGMKPPVPGGRTRIVVIHPVSGGEMSPYGLLAEGFPHMVRVSREVLDLDPSYRVAEDVPLLCRVQLLHEQALIPDLEAIEQQLKTALVNI